MSSLRTEFAFLGDQRKCLHNLVKFNLDSNWSEYLTRHLFKHASPLSLIMKKVVN